MPDGYRARSVGSGQPGALNEKTIFYLIEHMIPMGITPSSNITSEEAFGLMGVIEASKESVSRGPETLEARIRRLRKERREKFRKIWRKGYEQREERRRLAAVA